ncbi:hypothetical protein [Halomarina oriensis]|uniref:Uncharacterized protein n=1 Tax=Halomarina oriensis TaxID=671145 RepID=A0A6B0GLV4_9EURY|nr:hypothetical protein [Halomarina oriensis]MWG34469.1 hypothetical protein [Halomarina oriensis]
MSSNVRVRNREGEAVDPVPFFVVAGMAALGCYSFVPPYCLGLGLSVAVGLALATVVFVLVCVLSYYRLVWTVRPEVRREVPASDRLRTLFYVALVVVGVCLLASLPFYVR